MRYTFKVGNKYVWNYYGIPPKDFEINAKNKFGMLEDLEEEIGCPLEVVFKALDKGFVCEKFVLKQDNYKDYPEKWEQWKKENNNELQHIGNTKYLNLDMWYKIIYFSKGDTYMEIWLEDYKKTWWLREDKSEQYEEENW